MDLSWTAQWSSSLANTLKALVLDWETSVEALITTLPQAGDGPAPRQPSPSRRGGAQGHRPDALVDRPIPRVLRCRLHRLRGVVELLDQVKRAGPQTWKSMENLFRLRGARPGTRPRPAEIITPITDTNGRSPLRAATTSCLNCYISHREGSDLENG